MNTPRKQFLVIENLSDRILLIILYLGSIVVILFLLHIPWKIKEKNIMTIIRK